MHGFGQLAAFERHVRARDLRHLQGQPGADGPGEARGLRGEGVMSGPQVRDGVRAAIAGHCGDGDVRVDVGDRHGGIRHDRAGRVADLTGDRRRLLLRERARWSEEDHSQQRNHRPPSS